MCVVRAKFRELWWEYRCAFPDANIRVACLTCLGNVVSIHAPMIEVYHLLLPQKRGTGLSEQDGRSTAGGLDESSGNAPDSTRAAKESGYSSSGGGVFSSGIATPVLTSGVVTPTASESGEQEMSWLVRLCLRNVSPYASDPKSPESSETGHWSTGAHPLPVRLESLQLLAQITRGYFIVVRWGRFFPKKILSVQQPMSRFSYTFYAFKINWSLETDKKGLCNWLDVFLPSSFKVTGRPLILLNFQAHNTSLFSEEMISFCQDLFVINLFFTLSILDWWLIVLTSCVFGIDLIWKLSGTWWPVVFRDRTARFSSTEQRCKFFNVSIHIWLFVLNRV